MQSHHCHHHANKQRIDKKLLIAGVILLVILAVSSISDSALQSLNHSLLFYLEKIWWAVLLGLLLGGIIHHFVPDGFIQKYLGRASPLTLVYAVFAGFFLSACSHGILAIAIELDKKGASTASVITFLLASPWANLPVTILLFSFFGFDAILFIVAAMCIALICGFAFLVLENFAWVESSKVSDVNIDYNWKHLKNIKLVESVKGVGRGALQLSNMVLWWIIVGLLLAALISAYVPGDIFTTYLNSSATGLSLTLIAATVIEVCSEGSAPIAFELYEQTRSIGNPFVFLMAGVVTDYTELGLIWSNIGRKAAIMVPLITVPQVLVVGMWMNGLLF